MYKTTLFKIENKELFELQQTSLGDKEKDLQQWIWDDPDLLAVDIVLIGREVRTKSGAFIDLLAVDSQFNVCVIELKRDKTPREVVAQALDYASWVSTITWDDLNAISLKHFSQSATDRIIAKFGSAPSADDFIEPRMILVASQLDEASERIARFLTDRGVMINALFFTIFQDVDKQLLSTSWLIDPTKVEERIPVQNHSRTHLPSGYWFVNVGAKAGEVGRSWADNRKFGFLSAGGGVRWARMLGRIPVGAKVFAWLNGAGYVGFGEVTASAVPISEFRLTDGSNLNGSALEKPDILKLTNSADFESAIAIRWIKTVDPSNAVKGWHSVMTACALNQPEILSTLQAAFLET